jgi:hypothetical protein
MSEPVHDPRRDDDLDEGLEQASRTRVTPDGIREVGFDDPELRPLPPDKLHYHVPHSDAHPEQHEHSDVPIRPLAVALVGLAAMCVVTILLCYWVFWSFKGQQQAQELPRTLVPTARPDVPEPRLQGVPGFSDNHPTDDLRHLRQGFDADLTSYGRNGDAPTARIPIDRAMALALERKMFPVRGQSARGAPPQGAQPGAPAAPGAPQGAQRPAPKGGAR